MKKIITTLSLLSLIACSKQPNLPQRHENAVIQGINYVGKVVKDIEQSTKFYQHAVALNTIEQKTLINEPVFNQLARQDQLQIESRLLRSSNAQIRLLQFNQPSDKAKSAESVPVNGPGFGHLCFQVNDKTQAYQKFLAQGAKPIGDPEMIQLNPKNPVRYAYAKDIDDTTIEIEHVDVEKT